MATKSEMTKGLIEMKKSVKKPVNIRPESDVCLKCKNNGICQAQDGLVDYHCPKMNSPK